MKYIVISIFSLLSILVGIDETILINSSSFSDWKYFSFSTGEMLEIEIDADSAYSSLDWDIALMRNHFRTNSGKSGMGLGGVYIDSVSTFNESIWDEFNSIGINEEFTPDSILNNIYDIITHTYSEAPGNLVLETWGWFDFSNNYQFNVNNYKYVLRNANGESSVKLWLQDYYNELGQSAHITLRYSTDFICETDECGVCNGDGSTCVEDECQDIGDINNDGGYNVLDIVALASCVLSNNCSDLSNSCSADVNGDGGYNVLDIVALANCVLSNNCGGRIDDATWAKLNRKNSVLYIESDGYIGGIQMTIKHDNNFSMEINKNATFADYISKGGETDLLIALPEDELVFNYKGNFEILDAMVVNSIDEVPVELPKRFNLGKPFPNPFNPLTTINLTLPKSGFVNMQVINILGKTVAVLKNEYMEAKSYEIKWNAEDNISGVYFINASFSNTTISQKVVLVK